MKTDGGKASVMVFARAPRLGAVKTRLARDIGALAAWRFYRAETLALIRRLSNGKCWRLIVAQTPPRATWRCPAPRSPQGQGDLGQRMARALNGAGPGPRLLVGSDIPDLGRAQIRAAFLALKRSDLVFGPATDGGYWLIATRRRLPYGIFAGVRWSSQHALADTLANVPPTWRVAQLAPLQDVDTGADLRRWQRKKK